MFLKFAMLKKYSFIKSLECKFCNLENIIEILKVLPTLEELKVTIKAEDLITVVNYIESSNFGQHLKNIAITTTTSSVVLKTIQQNGDKMFCNYDRNKKEDEVDVTIEIDIKNHNKHFMYKFVNKPKDKVYK